MIREKEKEKYLQPKRRRIKLVYVADSENTDLPNDFIKIIYLQYKFSALYSPHIIVIIILYIIPYKLLKMN